MYCDKETLAQKMREYERKEAVCLRPDMPVVIRVDGRAFKHFTKGLKTPFDNVFRDAMKDTMLTLCEQVPGCILGYTFSDEISLILYPENQNDESRWFGYNVQKLASNTASMATLYFNKFFAENVENLIRDLVYNCEITPQEKMSKYPSEYIERLRRKCWTATFDSRAFSLPISEIPNYLRFRQMDCVRNSVPAVARAVFGNSSSLWDKKGIGEMIEMLKTTNSRWDSFSSHDKYGAFCIKRPKQFQRELNGQTINFIRNKWEVCANTPNMETNQDDVIALFPKI